MLLPRTLASKLSLFSLEQKLASAVTIATLSFLMCSVPLCAQEQPSDDSAGPRAISGPANASPSGTEGVASPSFEDTWKIGSKMGSAKNKVRDKYDVSKIGQRGIGGGVNFYSINKELMLGKQLSEELEASAKLVHDPVITEYINRIGQQIVRNSDAKVPFTIKVVDDEQVNAFALPGGFFYVNTGLILAADNEAELAGVMAHEVAHVAARHATKNATRGEIWNLASIPLIFMGGPAGFAIRQAAGLAVPMSFLKFGRDAEREADLLGIEYEYASGYDPAAFVQFFEKLKSQEKSKKNFLAKAFSTHPMTEDRITRAQEGIQTLLPARDQYVVDTSEFQQVKARLAELENRGRIENLDSSSTRPTLRRRPANDQGTEQKKDDDDRPVLRRR